MSGRYTALLLPLCSFPVLFNSARRVMTASAGPQVFAPAARDRKRGFSNFCLAYKCEWTFRQASVRIGWLPSNSGGPGPECLGILLPPDKLNDKLQHTDVNVLIKAVDQLKTRSRLGTVLEYYFKAPLGQLFRYLTAWRQSDCDLNLKSPDWHLQFES